MTQIQLLQNGIFSEAAETFWPEPLPDATMTPITAETELTVAIYVRQMGISLISELQ